MARSLYGQPPHSGTDAPMRAAESGNHQSQPVWADVVRKTEPNIQHIAAVAATNPQGHLLFQKRRDNGKWTNPAGHLDPGETAEQGVRRELLEETDLVPHRCEYLGSGSIPVKNLIVHCYRAHVDGVPSARNDPDQEAVEFRWVDCSQGLPTEIANNLHSPDNVLLKLLGLQDDVLEKGAMQRLAPFKPTSPISGGYEHTIPVDNLYDWQVNHVPGARDAIPRLEGPARDRALHKLHAAASAVRRGPSGEREFLLHRTMGDNEAIATQKNGKITHDRNSSWTPDATALSGIIGNHTVSAWIPESKIVTIPKQLGRMNLWDGIRAKVLPGGSNEYSHEHEVIVAPHSSDVHRHIVGSRDLTGYELEEALKSDPLEKGAMHRLAPFKPQDPNQRLDPTEESLLARWQGPDREPDDRGAGNSNMSTPARLRALHHLSARTRVRQNPETGEHEFLLHRGMSAEEYRHSTNPVNITHDKVISGNKKPDGMINHSESTSWTPRYDLARMFAYDYAGGDLTEPGYKKGINMNIASAWVPASAIAMIPKQYGALDTAADLHEPEDYKPRIGANDYGREHEVILYGDHNSTLATPEEVQSTTTPLKTVHGRINVAGVNEGVLAHLPASEKVQVLRTRFGKSEPLQKAPAIWQDSRQRLEEFADDNLRIPSENLVHEAVHQLQPNLWVHKFSELQAFKLVPGSTRKLTEYRMTNSQYPRQGQILGILGGTAHQDRKVKKFRVSSIAVDQKHRRAGLARVLYHHMLKDNGGHAESDTLVSPDAQGFYEGLARDKRFKVKLRQTGRGADSDTRHEVRLNKSLKSAFMALAAAGAMHAGTADAPEPGIQPRQELVAATPQPVKPKWTPAGLHPELYPIAHLESNMGRNVNHVAHSKGPFHTAYGALAMKPVTAFEQYHHDPHLKTMFPSISDENQFVDEFKTNSLFYNSIASAHWQHLKKVFGGNIHRAAFAWRFGQTAAHDASDADVLGSGYVKAFDKFSNRLKSKEELAKGMRVEHYSGVGGLKTLDPRKQGTGMPGKEAQRTDRIPRTFVYAAGAKPEGHIGTLPHKYEAELDPGINLYDMGKDSLGLLKPRKRQTNYGIIHEPVDLSVVERKIRRLGFHGYRNYNESVPDAIALFGKTPVKQVK